MDNELLVKSIRELCKKNNIPISQLEGDLNFGAGLISRWSKNSPSLDKIVAIADYFHVSLDEVVGYNHEISDEFLNKLYYQTSKNEIIWKKAASRELVSFPKIQLYDVEKDEYPPQLYDSEKYNQTHYATEFNGGYIIMYAFHRYGFILKPKVLKLFIQPTVESYIVEQEYSQNDLLKLWIKILNTLGDETPDEVRAEDFKNSFVNYIMKKSIESNTDEQLLQITKKMIEMEPQLPKVFEAIKKPEFIMFQQMFNSPQLKEGLNIAQKLSKYYEELKEIEE